MEGKTAYECGRFAGLARNSFTLIDYDPALKKNRILFDSKSRPVTICLVSQRMK